MAGRRNKVNMFATKKKLEETPGEKLIAVQNRIKDLDVWIAADPHGEDGRVREDLVNLSKALEAEVEAERNKPPIEPSMWRRIMRH